MKTMFCWPYEELTVEKLEATRAFRFSTPWYSSVVETTEQGVDLIDALFVQKNSDLSPQETLHSYAATLAPLLHEPFSYILSNHDIVKSDQPTDSVLSGDVFLTPAVFAKNFGLETEHLPQSWTWDTEEVLKLAQVEGTELYSPLTLFSVFRRFFYLEANEKDQTQSLYTNLPEFCPEREHMKNALASVISQNLYVTESCQKVLTAALPLAGNNEDKLLEFAQAEEGHDQIMISALKAFPEPALKPWSREVAPSTKALMETFYRVAQNNFLAFAFAIYLFERPHFEETHPVTKLLKTYDFHEAAEKYERHHIINEAGGHDHIGFEMIKEIPLLTKAAAEQAVRWCEAMSWVMTTHSAALLQNIRKHI